MSETNSSSLKTNTYLLKLAHEGEPGDWKRADGLSAAISFVTLALALAAISTIGVVTGGTGIIPTIGIIAALLEISVQSALASIHAFYKS